MKTVEERLAALEAAIAGMRDEICSKRIVVKDEKGRMRIVLGVDEDGPKLWMYDEKGEMCAALHALKDGPGLSLWDENGKLRVGLCADKDGPALSLHDEKGKIQTRSELTASQPMRH